MDRTRVLDAALVGVITLAVLAAAVFLLGG